MFFAGVWLLLVFDYAVTGGLTALINLILPPFANLVDPKLVAWGGGVIPLTLLAGTGILWAWDHTIQPKINYTMTYRHVYWVAGIGSILAIILVPFFLGLSNLNTDSLLNNQDIKALKWVHDNTPEDAVIATLPTDISAGAWAIAITERQSVDLPPLPIVINPIDADLTGVTHLFIPSDYQREKARLLPENAVDVYEGLIYVLSGTD